MQMCNLGVRNEIPPSKFKIQISRKKVKQKNNAEVSKLIRTYNLIRIYTVRSENVSIWF